MQVQTFNSHKLKIQKTALEFWFILLVTNSISIFALFLASEKNRPNLIVPLCIWFAITFVFAAIWGNESFSNCVFDRKRNSFTLTRKQWLRITNVEKYSLDEIAEVEIETINNGMGDKQHRITIKLKSEKKIPLTRGYCGYDYRETVAILRQFLNLG